MRDKEGTIAHDCSGKDGVKVALLSEFSTLATHLQFELDVGIFQLATPVLGISIIPVSFFALYAAGLHGLLAVFPL